MMRAYLDRFWDRALAAFQAAVAEEPQKEDENERLPPVRRPVVVATDARARVQGLHGRHRPVVAARAPHRAVAFDREALEPGRRWALVRAPRKTAPRATSAGAGLGAVRTAWCWPGRSPAHGSTTPSFVTEVEVTFTPEGPRHLRRRGAPRPAPLRLAEPDYRKAIDSKTGGWGYILGALRENHRRMKGDNMLARTAGLSLLLALAGPVERRADHAPAAPDPGAAAAEEAARHVAGER